MSFLDRISTAISRHVDPKKVPLTHKAARRYLASCGWTVSKTPVDIVDFFIEKPDAGRLCVHVSKQPVVRGLVFDLTRPAVRYGVTGLILSELAPSQELRDYGLHSGVLLIQWEQIDQLARLYKAMAETLKQELIAAKMSQKAKLPRLDYSIAIPLTAAQRNRDFLTQTEEVACWFVDRGGDTLLVTFSQWGSDPEAPTCWGEAYSRAMGISALGFETSSPNWYPEEHTLECIDVALRHMAGRFPKRLLLGASQGGFAALRYSAALGATDVLAISPPYSIDPVITDNARFRSRYIPSLNSGMHIAAADLAGDATVCFDPHDESDSVQAALIRERLRCRMIPLPFAGHAPGFLLSKPAVVTKLLAQCLTKDTGAIGRLLTGYRHENTSRAVNMALYLSQRKPALAYAIFEKYREREHRQSWSAVCYRLAEVGMATRVIDWLIGLVASGPPDPELSCCLALVGLKADRLEIAYEAIGQSIAARPDDEKYQYVQDLIVKARASGVTT